MAEGLLAAQSVATTLEKDGAAYAAITYARTHDHPMGVATGAAAVTTHFDVPAGTETGASELVVIANGIASAPVSVMVS